MESGTGCGNEVVSMLDAIGERQKIDRLRVEVRGKFLDLFNVKHCIAFHERNGVFHGLALVVGLCLGETIGKDDERTMLALRTCAPSSWDCLSSRAERRSLFQEPAESNREENPMHHGGRHMRIPLQKRPDGNDQISCDAIDSMAR